MAIYRKQPARSDGADARPAKLGRGLDSLADDNAATPPKKKPLVVSHGPCDPDGASAERRNKAVPPPKRPSLPEAGGRVVVRTDALPDRPIRSARSTRKGTTVLIRTERGSEQKRYRVGEHIPPRSAEDARLDRPIVIKPRGKK